MEHRSGLLVPHGRLAIPKNSGSSVQGSGMQGKGKSVRHKHGHRLDMCMREMNDQKKKEGKGRGKQCNIL